MTPQDAMKLRLLVTLGGYRPVSKPVMPESYPVILANAASTKQFCDLVMPDLEENEYLYKALSQARKSCIELRRVRPQSLRTSKKALDKLARAYDNFVSAVSIVVQEMDPDLEKYVFLCQ